LKVGLGDGIFGGSGVQPQEQIRTAFANLSTEFQSLFNGIAEANSNQYS
jgi:hypothetical protein